MVLKNDITLCLTAGGRPDLLRRTLASLLAQNDFEAAVISNDVGDAETTAVAREMMPGATVIHHDTGRGHTRTVDELYSEVRTSLIFHCEDDWYFDPVPFLERARSELLADEKASSIQVRQSSDLFQQRQSNPGNNPTDVDVVSELHAGNDKGWASWSFNPCLTRLSLWRSVGPFAQYKTEGGIDQQLRKTGMHIRYLRPGICYHIGLDRHIADPSVAPPPKPLFWKPFYGLGIRTRLRRMLGEEAS